MLRTPEGLAQAAVTRLLSRSLLSTATPRHRAVSALLAIMGRTVSGAAFWPDQVARAAAAKFVQSGFCSLASFEEVRSAVRTSLQPKSSGLLCPTAPDGPGILSKTRRTCAYSAAH